MMLFVATTMGDYIRARREGLGWTQVRLAAEAATSPAYISQIESGKVALPSADLRRRLAKALGVSHLDLLVAAGEITRDEIRAVGVEGVTEPDPVLAELIADLRRLPLTGERPTTFRRLLDVFAENDRRSAESGQKTRDVHEDRGGDARIG